MLCPALLSATPTHLDEVLSTKTGISIRTVNTLQVIKPLGRPQHPEFSPHDDKAMEDLQNMAQDNPSYIRLQECERQGFPCNCCDLHNTLLLYWKLHEDLYCDGDLILYAAYAVVPAALHCCILARLLNSHQGAEVTRRHARQAVYRPGINSYIVNTLYVCELCQNSIPTNNKRP